MDQTEQSRRLLDQKVFCPFSGVTLDGEFVKPHRIEVTVCANGSLYSYCMTHGTRVFVRDRIVVAKFTRNAQVLKVLPKKTQAPKNPPRRRKTHAAQVDLGVHPGQPHPGTA